MSLENGMDMKTLSTIIGHVSSATTLNTYTHVTDEMRQKAAANIDRGIAKAEVQPEPEQETEKPHAQESFTPFLPARRRPGTGYVKQIKENLWEGRYSPVWPDGKKHSRNVYGHTEAECEEKLTALLEDKEKTLLLRLINAENEIGSTMALENFILGFRLGVRIILEALDEDDGSLIDPNKEG